MMRDRMGWGWIAIAAIAGGCAAGEGGDPGGPGDPDEPGDADEQPGTAMAPPPGWFQPFPPPGALCSWRRTIVYHSVGPCPAAAGWSVGSVFTGAEVEMRRYCRYQRIAAGEPTAADMAALPGNSPRSPDCLVVFPAAEEAWSVAHEAFLDQVEAPTLAWPPPSDPAPSTTWVAIVDTSPRSPFSDGEAWAGSDPHGYILGRLVREIGCPDGPGAGTPCVAHIHHELALSRFFNGNSWSTPAGGGRFGYQSDVAAAIERAVDAWSQGRARPTDRLIVNLSLGWLPPFGGAAGDSVSELPAARQVYAAIQKVVCRGGLVFAAAGNDSGGQSYGVGPIYPAAWTRDKAPTASRCKAFGTAVPGYLSTGRLLEAVGGVDGADQPLAIARENSTPRIVAPGAFAAAIDPIGAPLRPLTGTSVSTAVASAAAAVAWAYVPAMPAPILADKVYASGPLLGRVADAPTCPDGCWSVRRVSVCGALAEACRDGGGVRPGCAVNVCAGRPAFADARAPLRASMFPAPDEVWSAAGLAPLVGITPAGCGETTALYRPVGAAGPGMMPCPDRQFYSGAAHPDVAPQPSGAGCTVCNRQQLTSTLRVEVQLDLIELGGPLSYPSVKVVTTAGKFRYALWELPDGPGWITAGPLHRIDGVPRPPGTIISATLNGLTWRGEAWSAELFPLTDPPEAR